jgi:hypothetical protein
MSKYRYEFKRVVKGGIPCLSMTDKYCEPLLSLETLLKHEGPKETHGYGAGVIDKILDMLEDKGNQKQHIVVRESMSKIKKALEDLGEAMEEYDDATGSTSSFSFTSTPTKGDVFTSEMKNQSRN